MLCTKSEEFWKTFRYVRVADNQDSLTIYGHRDKLLNNKAKYKCMYADFHRYTTETATGTVLLLTI